MSRMYNIFIGELMRMNSSKFSCSQLIMLIKSKGNGDILHFISLRAIPLEVVNQVPSSHVIALTTFSPFLIEL